MKAALALALLLAACGGTARTATAYRNDTRTALATRDGQIKTCYDDALAKDRAAKGSVAVKFTVAKKTGVFSRASVDPASSSAPPALQACVVRALEGLVLAPPDKQEGAATFVYELTPKS